LSEMTPSENDSSSMFKLDWTPIMDANVRGGRLQVASKSYDRGIGVHSRSLLSYGLDGGYRELVVAFGMDDDSGPLANVNVSIAVDDIEKLKKEGVVAGKLHGPVRIDLRKAEHLRLVVDFGENEDIQDRFDWIEAGLIKNTP